MLYIIITTLLGNVADGVFAVTSYFDDWDKFTLVTPVDKKENVKFYTEKCGFDIVATEMDGNVKVARFVLGR